MCLILFRVWQCAHRDHLASFSRALSLSFPHQHHPHRTASFLLQNHLWPLCSIFTLCIWPSLPLVAGSPSHSLSPSIIHAILLAIYHPTLPLGIAHARELRLTSGDRVLHRLFLLNSKFRSMAFE